MGIDISRLGQDAQRQLSAALRKNAAPKENKVHARFENVRMPDGSMRKCASGREARRLRELLLMQRAGQISDLRCQVEYVLVPKQKRPDGSTERAVKYVSDFEYIDADGVKHTEDAKGMRDTGSAMYKLFVVKRKLMLHVHGIAVEEV